MENWSDSIISATQFCKMSRQSIESFHVSSLKNKISIRPNEERKKNAKPSNDVFYNPIIFIMDYGKTFFSLVDVVNVYGDKNFLSGVHTQKI